MPPLPGRAGQILQIGRRAIALRCPRCGGTDLFTGWFRMRPECALCGLRFEREQGYFVGAIYVNYAVTSLIAIGGFFLLWTTTRLSMRVQLTLWSVFVVVFPLWFFRYSRSVWLAIAYLVNPEP
jgi:uncharacterized protein (DUF983 family)